MKFPNFSYFRGSFLLSWIRIRFRIDWPDKITVPRTEQKTPRKNTIYLMFKQDLFENDRYF